MRPPTSRGARPSAPGKGAALQISELVVEETMSVDEMIACLGSCRARLEIAAMIKALSLHPWLNTPAETKRLEAARAAMENWKSYSHACQARHNAQRLRHSDRRTGQKNNEPAAFAAKIHHRLELTPSPGAGRSTINHFATTASWSYP
jgi:hypothetical protein